MLEARTTIAVVIRESHSITPAMLETLFAHTPAPRRVVVVLGGEPRRVRQVLERLAVEHDFTFVHADAVITANEARNLALDHVSTPYVCFLDNDTFVPEQWLQNLERCADETGASVVACPILWGHGDDWDIHYAGGTCRIVDEDGIRRLDEHNPLMHKPVSALATLVRSPTEYVEPHLLLARTAAVRPEGIFDEGLVAAARAHHAVVADPSSRAARSGSSLPSSSGTRGRSATRSPTTPGTCRDGAASRRRVPSGLQRALESQRHHDRRRVPVGAPGSAGGPTPSGQGPPRTVQRVGYPVVRAVDLVVTPVLIRRCDRRHARAGPAEVLHTATWDRAGAPRAGQRR